MIRKLVGISDGDYYIKVRIELPSKLSHSLNVMGADCKVYPKRHFKNFFPAPGEQLDTSMSGHNADFTLFVPSIRIQIADSFRQLVCRVK